MLSFVRAGNYALVMGYPASSNDFVISPWNTAEVGNGVRLTPGAVAWTSTSDERTKTIESELTGVLPKIAEVRCVRYRYKTDCLKDKYGRCQYDRSRIGFIAQDVQKVFPEAVHDSGGVLGLTYQDIIVVNTAAIKELTLENETLRARVKRLEDARPWFRGLNRERQQRWAMRDLEERLLRLEEAQSPAGGTVSAVGQK